MNTKITIYTCVNIAPHHAGFGMWERGEIQSSPTNSYAMLSDLLAACSDGADVLPVEEAVENPDFIAAGAENILGHIYNQPSRVYARLANDGDLSYFGIVEDEVDADFFN